MRQHGTEGGTVRGAQMARGAAPGARPRRQTAPSGRHPPAASHGDGSFSSSGQGSAARRGRWPRLRSGGRRSGGAAGRRSGGAAGSKCRRLPRARLPASPPPPHGRRRWSKEEGRGGWEAQRGGSEQGRTWRPAGVRLGRGPSLRSVREKIGAVSGYPPGTSSSACIAHPPLRTTARYTLPPPSPSGSRQGHRQGHASPPTPSVSLSVTD